MAIRRHRRRRRRYKKSVASRIFSALLCCILLCFIALGVGAGYIIKTSKPIDPSTLYKNIEQTSTIYDCEDNEIETLYFTEDRVLVKSEDIPLNMKNAVIAIEDKTFYKHHGVNFKRMAGAVIYKILGKSDRIGGTSTITQQLARNVYLSDIKSERTITRKATEIWYAWQIEQVLSKDEILEAYLNSIYLGYGNYGVGSAAETYYSKDVSELSLAESASLAALPQAPDTYALLMDEEGEHTTELESGVYANDASKDRRDTVLDLMAEQGYITQAEADEAKVDIADILDPHFKSASSKYTYFADYVTSQVIRDLEEAKGLTEDEAKRMVYTSGLKIYSTIDPDAQKVIAKEFKDDDNFPSCVDGETKPQASMVITEIGTGKIVAMAGGRGASGKKLFNRATSPRQPGSSIKPLSVYSAALQKSYELEKEGKTFDYTDFGYDKQGVYYWGKYITAGSYVSDERMVVNGKVWPLNVTRSYTGRNTFRTALQNSINTCAVKIQLQVGADYSIKMLKKYGITTVEDDESQPTNDINSAALALGAMTYGVTPLEMAVAYATFPNGGTRIEPVAYTKICDSDGNEILVKEPKTTQVLDEGVAWIMTDVLKSVVSNGIARNAYIAGTEVGGKTGTTNDSYDIWFCGFTPKYSAALWIGTDKNVEMNALSDRAAWLWSEIVSQVPGATDGNYREKPSDVITYGREYYTKGTEGGAYYPKTKKKKSSGSSSGSSGSSNSSGSGSSGSSGGGASSREQFVEDFNDGDSSSGSSRSSGSSGSSGGSGGGSSRDDWAREWQDNN